MSGKSVSVKLKDVDGRLELPVRTVEMKSAYSDCPKDARSDFEVCECAYINYTAGIILQLTNSVAGYCLSRVPDAGDYSLCNIYGRLTAGKYQYYTGFTGDLEKLIEKGKSYFYMRMEQTQFRKKDHCLRYQKICQLQKDLQKILKEDNILQQRNSLYFSAKPACVAMNSEAPPSPGSSADKNSPNTAVKRNVAEKIEHSGTQKKEQKTASGKTKIREIQIQKVVKNRTTAPKVSTPKKVLATDEMAVLATVDHCNFKLLQYAGLLCAAESGRKRLYPHRPYMHGSCDGAAARITDECIESRKLQLECIPSFGNKSISRPNRAASNSALESVRPTPKPAAPKLVKPVQKPTVLKSVKPAQKSAVPKSVKPAQKPTAPKSVTATRKPDSESTRPTPKPSVSKSVKPTPKPVAPESVRRTPISAAPKSTKPTPNPVPKSVKPAQKTAAAKSVRPTSKSVKSIQKYEKISESSTVQGSVPKTKYDTRLFYSSKRR